MIRSTSSQFRSMRSRSTRGRHRHRPCQAAARTGRAAHHSGAVADRRPGHPRRRRRRIRRTPSGPPATGSAGPAPGTDALEPCPAQGRTAPAATHAGATAPARRRVRLRPARHLGHPRHVNGDRYPPLWHRHRPFLGPAPPQTHPPLLLGRSRRHPPDRRRDRYSPGHRPPAQRSNPQAGLAVVVRHQHVHTVRKTDTAKPKTKESTTPRPRRKG